MTRTELEETGFEALQRLYEVACTDTGQAGVVGRFLLGLYNGQRFAFDLTDLRRLDDALFNDCMQVLTMDARLAPREIHQYFSEGGRKFERMAFRLGLAGQPAEDLQRSAGKGTITLREEDFVEMKVVSMGDAPGYRDIPMTLAIGSSGIKVDTNLSKNEAIRLMQHIQDVNALAWRGGKKPIDAEEGETRPLWVKEQSST